MNTSWEDANLSWDFAHLLATRIFIVVKIISVTRWLQSPEKGAWQPVALYRWNLWSFIRYSGHFRTIRERYLLQQFALLLSYSFFIFNKFYSTDREVLGSWVGSSNHFLKFLHHDLAFLCLPSKPLKSWKANHWRPIGSSRFRPGVGQRINESPRNVFERPCLEPKYVGYGG